MKRVILTMLLVCFATTVSAFTVQRTTLGTILRKSTSGVPDYGSYGYVYSPSVMRLNGATYAWLGGGVNTLDGSGNGGDHILFTTNWGAEQAVLCPRYLNEATPLSICQGMYREGVTNPSTGDHNGVCDPTVVKVGNVFYMYYTADPAGGANNQMFLATSMDGLHWAKYPNNSVPATSVIAFLPTGRYGVGEGSVVYKDQQFVLYYTDFPWYSDSTVRRATSYDGVNFSTGVRVLSDSTIPWGNEGTGGADVKYIPGWQLWVMVTPTYSKQDLVWNISRDGIHWLPWSGAFGNQTRRIVLPRRFATAPGLESDAFGQVGDGSLAANQTVRLYYAAGDSQYIAGCADPRSYLGNECYGGIDNPLPPDESAGFWQWSIDAADVTWTPEALYGSMEGVTADKIAYGWAYDKDTGTNDAASNGSPSAPLGHDTWVRPVAYNTATGQRIDGRWQSAQLSRPDLVTAGVAPDQYHGYNVDLKTQSFPSGTYRVVIEGGEFPTGMGARELSGEAVITFP